MIDFSDYQASFDLVKTLSNFDDAIAANVEIYLRESAAVNATNITQYRPYWVIAKLIEQAPEHQQFSGADGVGFTGMSRPIQSYLDIQRGIDRKNAWVIPFGFEVLNAGEDLPILNVGTTSVQNTRIF